MSSTPTTARDLLQPYFRTPSLRQSCGADYISRAVVNLAVC